MLARKKLSPQKTIIMVSIIAVIWVIIGVLAYSNFGKKSVPLGANGQPYSKLIDFGTGTKKTTDFDALWPTGADILKDDRYTNLKTYGSVPVMVESKELGRVNPFEPLPTQPTGTNNK